MAGIEPIPGIAPARGDVACGLGGIVCVVGGNFGGNVTAGCDTAFGITDFTAGISLGGVVFVVVGAGDPRGDHLCGEEGVAWEPDWKSRMRSWKPGDRGDPGAAGGFTGDAARRCVGDLGVSVS